MRLPNVQIKDAILAKFTKPGPDELRSGILVPVNSSANAFNSLEYALKLAKVLNNTIHLFYVIDVSISELSESTIVANRVLERIYRNSETCVESLKEMIEESGVKVVTAESKIGNTGSLIQKQIELIRPGMIVIGRDCFTRNTITNLITYSTCPVIAIPESASPRLPSSVILTNEQNSFPEKSINPLIKIIERTTKELTILNFIKFKKNRMEKVAVPHVSTRSVLLNYQQVEDSPSANSVDGFVQARAVDLVCTIHKKQSLFSSFFRRGFSAEIVFGLEIPVMIMRET
jgi:nucleotide-binding universal stress UspA family protein